MKGKEYIVKFEKDKAFLTANKHLTLDKLGIKFSNFRTISWRFKVRNYNPLTKTIVADITKYNLFDEDFSEDQLNSLELQEIEMLKFRDISTPMLMNALEPLATTSSVRFQLPRQKEQLAAFSRDPIVNTIKEIFLVPIKKLQFKQGYVTFEQNIKKLKKIVDITVPNDFIKEEFDAIKNYFVNVFGTKRITVNVSVETKNGQIANIESESEQITQINENLIENVRFEFLKHTTKKLLKAKVEQMIFDRKELINTLSDTVIKEDAIYKNDNELFEDILKIQYTKHYYHLRFLSSKHSSTMKLRFIFKPFSFLFMIEGQQNHYIIWETLSTMEATYIWTIPNSGQEINLALRKIEGLINKIKNMGKKPYIQTADDDFRRLFHEYSENDEGFKKWKIELENIIK